jgi:DNA modification methylase
MAHKSEHSARLPIVATRLSGYRELLTLEHHGSDVWLLVLPFGRRLKDAARNTDWVACLRKFAETARPNAIVTVLTTPEDAAVLWPELSKLLHFQLWVAVKLREPRDTGPGCMPEQHAALLVLSKYRGALKHTKTRIAYTYCPACDKTTKDYGGKKHTYHAYGTLMSDVWRDVDWSPEEEPLAVAERLADLFGLAPHQELRLVDLVGDTDLKPESGHSCRPPTCVNDGIARLSSQLLQGDCLDILRKIPGNSVDFCFADPPYNLAKRYDSCEDALDIVEYFKWCDQWLDELARVLKPGRTCAVLNIPQWTIRHFAHLRQRLQFQNWIVWEGLSMPVRMIMPSHYSILCFSKGEPVPLPGRDPAAKIASEQEAVSVLRERFCLRASCLQTRRARGVEDREAPTDLWWDIHRLKHNSRRVEHPCQLPPALMSRLIVLFTSANEVVLDPFNGAGTTTLCAEALVRRFIGIELSEQYHQLASERHELLRRGGDPFAKEGRVPVAKNNRVKRIGSMRYEVSKKTLQLEVREIARRLGRLPTREEVARMSKYPIRYFEDYFLSWGEVCAAARTTGMKETKDNGCSAPILRAEPTLFDGLE